MFMRRSSTITLLCGLALLPTLALAQPAARLDRSLAEAQREGRSSRVIVKARAGYRAWLKQQLAAQGKHVGAEHESIDALSVELSAAEVEAVCGDPATNGCSVDAVVSPSASFSRLGTDDTVASNTALAALGLSTGRRAGAGVTVALIDSGIHPRRPSRAASRLSSISPRPTSRVRRPTTTTATARTSRA